MDCAGAKASLCDYLENDLGPDQVAQLEAHMQACPQCSELLLSYRKTTVLCKYSLTRYCPTTFASRLIVYLKDQLQRPK